MDKTLFFRESQDYFGCMEGVVNSPLFHKDIPTLAKKCEEVYIRRCIQYFESFHNESRAVLEQLLRATKAYLIDLLEEYEDEFDLGEGFTFDEDSDLNEVLTLIKPEQLVFEKLGVLTDEDAPPVFALKLCFSPVPDQTMEWAVRDGQVIYVGEYRGVSPWNEKLAKKKWNYINRL